MPILRTIRLRSEFVSGVSHELRTPLTQIRLLAELLRLGKIPDEARRELLILWNVYAFFVTYARLAGWTPDTVAPSIAERPILDRWILSRAAGTAAVIEERLQDVDAVGATRALSGYLDGLSTWYLRLSRRRFSRAGDARDRAAAFATLHETLVATARMLAPILPFLADDLYQNLVTAVQPDAPDSVHLTHWPTDELASHRDPDLERAMAAALASSSSLGRCAAPPSSRRVNRWQRRGSPSASSARRWATSCAD
jgi:isoleucyl-tRNA synthetase